MKELTGLLVCIIVIFVYTNYIRKSLYLSRIESTINQQKYYVRNLPDKQGAADYLAEISQSLTKLIQSLNVEDNERGEGLKRLKNKFDPKQITENIPGSMYVAYSVNKGEELSICIREKETEKFLDSALISGMDFVHILHGKGTGALMEAIHEYLKEQSFISEFHFADEDQGGAGITVVELY